MSLTSFLRRLSNTRQRALIWIHGPQAWGRRRVQELLPELEGQGVLVSDHPLGDMQALSAREAHRYLGHTLDYLVFDAFAGFNPNTFGQLSGALKGGAPLILLTPSADDWPDFQDPEYKALCVEPYRPKQVNGRFLDFLVSVLAACPYRISWSPQGMSLPEYWPEARLAEPPEGPCMTPDQAGAVEAIMRAVSRRRRPLVLTADRGRGKSAALGIAAARLLLAGKTVAVTAPDAGSVAALQQQVQQLAPAHAEMLCFRRPDQLLHLQDQAQVLLVDEAAAIPVPVLLQLVERFPRTVFATTVHGYEGNGQGFALRFLARLRSRGIEYDEVRLEAPIRWSAPDPLEQLCHSMLLLDADASLPTSAGELRFEQVDRDALISHPEYLKQLFGLLVLAHYRTSPGDLRILLDSPNMLLFTACQGDTPVGCVLVAREGPLSSELAEAVWEGRRRPQGHLLPQALVAQEGWQEAAHWSAWRVVRIAVHPQRQQQGIGEQLLQQVRLQAEADQVDYLGASFAAEPGLVRFWQACDYWPIRLGEQRDPVAGSHAVIVIAPLTNSVDKWFEEARCWYQRSLLARLPGQLADLEPQWLPDLLCKTPAIELSAADLKRLQGFAYAQRSFESSLLPLTLLVQRSLSQWSRLGLGADDLHLLCQRVLRQEPAARVLQPNGRKAQQARLRQLCDIMLRQVCGES